MNRRHKPPKRRRYRLRGWFVAFVQRQPPFYSRSRNIKDYDNNARSTTSGERRASSVDNIEVMYGPPSWSALPYCYRTMLLARHWWNISIVVAANVVGYCWVDSFCNCQPDGFMCQLVWFKSTLPSRFTDTCRMKQNEYGCYKFYIFVRTKLLNSHLYKIIIFETIYEVKTKFRLFITYRYANNLFHQMQTFLSRKLITRGTCISIRHVLIA